ncbi:MAG: hypothetical protein ACYT04_26180 [Nostoc sp.]
MQRGYPVSPYIFQSSRRGPLAHDTNGCVSTINFPEIDQLQLCAIALQETLCLRVKVDAILYLLNDVTGLALP